MKGGTRLNCSDIFVFEQQGNMKWVEEFVAKPADNRSVNMTDTEWKKFQRLNGVLITCFPYFFKHIWRGCRLKCRLGWWMPCRKRLRLVGHQIANRVENIYFFLFIYLVFGLQFWQSFCWLRERRLYLCLARLASNLTSNFTDREWSIALPYPVTSRFLRPIDILLSSFNWNLSSWPFYFARQSTHSSLWTKVSDLHHPLKNRLRRVVCNATKRIRTQSRASNVPSTSSSYSLPNWRDSCHLFNSALVYLITSMTVESM